MIHSILPVSKDGKYQLYKVLFEEHFVVRSMIDREKKILNFFDIDKNEFKLLLITSIRNEDN